MENNPHKVPQGFFDSQKEDILKAVLNENKSTENNSRVIRLFSPALKVAAALAVIVLSTFAINSLTSEECKTFACLLDSTDLQNLNDIESSTLEEWEYELYDEYEYESLTQ